MKKLAIGVLSVGALAVAGALTISYHVGERIQQEFENTAQAWSSDNAFNVRVLEYQRGIVSSHAITMWSFVGEEDSYDIVATHDMVHGPWPMGQAAEITTRFQLPDSGEPELAQALDGRAPLQWTITADWQGATQHALASPDFSVQFQDQSSLAWGGFQAQWHLSAERTAAKGEMHMPLMQMKVEDDNQMTWEDVAIHFDSRIPEGHNFWEGPAQLKVGLLAIQEPESATDFRMQQWHIDSAIHLQDRLVQMRLDSRAAKLDTADYSASNAVLTLQMRNIDASWLDQLMQWFQRSNAPEQEFALWQDLPALLASQPEIAIERLGLETQDGPARLSAHLRYVGKQPDAFNPATDIQAMLHASVPKAMLMQLLEAKVRSDYLALLEQLGQELEEQALEAAVQDGLHKRLQSLIELGALQESETQYAAELELEQGELKLNGTPTEMQTLLQLGDAI